ncbi:MAG TPA: head GIN domain-containing protein [Devosiaceae bacterium]|jgi:hypothetical protein|nr:head GIN domain-containing protein [Devosiaceae bacterium]
MQKLQRAAALGGVMCALVMPTLAAEARYDLPPFTAIDITSGINATVTVGEEQSVQAMAPKQEELDELILEVRDGMLTAKVDWNLLDFMFGDREISLVVEVPRLHSVEASSGADVEVEGLAADDLTLNVSSGADLTIRSAFGGTYEIDVSSGSDLRIDGQCESASIDVSSGGTLRGSGLQCQSVRIDASSGGDADVYADAQIVAEASSGGDVYVAGDPQEREIEESSGGEIAFEE